MFNELSSKFFWFTPPSSILGDWDKYFAYIFLGLVIFALVLWLLTKFAIKHAVYKKLFKKFGHMAFPIGLTGMFWFLLRYENTPIFSQRYWAGLTVILGVIWLLFILKYLVFNFRTEKKEYDREMIKNKYIPGSNRK